MVKAVIFDMDGTIVDSIPLHYGIWEKIAQRYDFPMNRDIFDYENGMDTPKIAKYIVEKYKLGVTPEMIAQEKRQLASEALNQDVKLFPNAVETVQKIKRSGYKVGLATMTPRDHVEKTLGENLRLMNFDYIVTDSEVHNSKPDPEIFLRCAAGLNVQPQQCVVLEDAINGIKAARAAGMVAVAITNTTLKEKFDKANYVIDSILDLPPLLSRIAFLSE